MKKIKTTVEYFNVINNVFNESSWCKYNILKSIAREVYANNSDGEYYGDDAVMLSTLSDEDLVDDEDLVTDLIKFTETIENCDYETLDYKLYWAEVGYENVEEEDELILQKHLDGDVLDDLEQEAYDEVFFHLNNVVGDYKEILDELHLRGKYTRFNQLVNIYNQKSSERERNRIGDRTRIFSDI